MGQQVTRISAPKPSSGTAIIGGTTPATIGTRPALTLPSTPATAIEPCKLGDQRLTPAYAAELVEIAPDGGHLWADRFDGALEDQVTESVVGAIAPKLEQAELILR